MNYYIRHKIQPHYDTWGNESGPNRADKPKDAPFSEKEKKALEQLWKDIITNISAEDQKGAIRIIEDWIRTFENNNKPREYREFFKILEWEIRYNTWLSQKSETEKIQYLTEKLQKFLQSAKITPDNWDKQKSPEAKKNPEKEIFLKKYGDISSFGDTLVTFVIKHPQRASLDIAYNNPLIEAKKDLEKAWKEWLEWYSAIIESLLQIAKTKTFERNTGFTDKVFSDAQKKSRMQIFESFLREIIQKAGNTQKIQSIDGFENKDFREESGWLSLEDEKVLTEKPVDKLYEYFLQWLKSNTLKKEGILAYINGLSAPILPVIAKLPPDNPIRKGYEEKFASMRAIAENDILYDGWSQFGSIFTGKTLDKFIRTLEESKGKNGSIWYDKDGNFVMYTPEQLSEEIMSDGKIDWTADVAWNNYIKSTGWSIDKMKKIFSEEWLFALHIYTQNNSNPTFGDGQAKVFIARLEEYYANGSHVDPDLYFWKKVDAPKDKTPSWIEKMNIQDDFRNLQLFIQENNIKLNPIEKIPTRDGYVDGVKLILDLIRGQDISPAKIEWIKIAIEKDFREKSENYQKRRQENIEWLQWKYNTWWDALRDVGVSPKIWEKDISTHSLKQNLTQEEIKILEREIQWKLDSSTDEEQKGVLKWLLTIIQSQAWKDNANTAAKQLAVTQSEDIKSASGDPKKEEVLANATHKAAKASVNRENIEENRKNELNNPELSLLYKKYNIPEDTSELAKPRYLNTLKKIIGELEQKTEKTNAEKIFLNQLYDIVQLIQVDAAAISAVREMQQQYPEMSGTRTLIEQNTEVFKNITPQEIAQYEYIHMPYPLSESAKFMVWQEIWWESISIKELYKWNNDVSSYIQDARIQRTWTTECQISFPDSPTGRYLDSIGNIPLKWIDSFVAQSELYTRLWLHALIPLIPAINREISRNTGKSTNSLDGTFDVSELKRNISVLWKILETPLDGTESIDQVAQKIQTKYSSQRNIESELIRQWILHREGWYNDIILSERVKTIFSSNQI